MKITIDFGHPYFDAETIRHLTLDDLNDFYAEAGEVDQLNLFFVLEASLHRLQGEKDGKASARCVSHDVLPLYRADASGVLRAGRVLHRPGAGMG